MFEKVDPKNIKEGDTVALIGTAGKGLTISHGKVISVEDSYCTIKGSVEVYIPEKNGDTTTRTGLDNVVVYKEK